MTVRELFVRFGADTTSFNKGAAEVKKRLGELNTEYYKNQREIANLKSSYRQIGSNIDAVSKQLSKNKGNVNAQSSALETLKKKQSEVALKIGQTTAKQQELRSSIRSTTRELSSHNSELKQTESLSNRTSTSFFNLTNALRALAMGYTGRKLGESLFGGNAEMEQYITSFKVMLSDVSKAQNLMNDLVNFAAHTPLQLDQSAKNADLLLNYGVAYDKIIEKMTQLGNLGKGKADKMDRISLAYGQMLAKGKVTGEELRQMTEAGVPLTKALADTMGIATGELMKFIEKGQVGIPELDKAITNITTGTGQFAGMMEEQSKTMNGLFSTLMDNMKQIGRDTGAEGFEVLKSNIKGTLDLIKEARESGSLKIITDEVGRGVANTIKIFTDGIKILWEYRTAIMAGTTALITYKVAVGGLNTALAIAKGAQVALNAVTAANPWLVVAGVIVTVTGGLMGLSAATNISTDALSNLNSEMERAKKAGEEKRVLGEHEIEQIKEKGTRYEELRQKVSKTAEEEAELKGLAEEMTGILPEAINVVNKETGAYNSLAQAIEKVISRKRAEIMLEANEDAYKQAILSKDQYKEEAEIASSAWSKALKKKNDYYKSGGEKATSGMGVDAWNVMNEGEVENNVFSANKHRLAAEYAYKDNEKVISDYENMLADFEEQYGAFRDSIVDKTEDTGGGVTAEISSTADESKKLLKNWVSDMQSQYDKYYNYRKEKQNKYYSEKIKAIEKEAKAEEKRINKIIKFIDDEIKARQRLKADNTDDLKIEAMEAQLKYSQMDDFSRRELEREITRLKEEKAERKWLEGKNDKKDRLKEELASIKEEAAAEKEAVKERQEKATERLKKERENIKETFELISKNFTSLSDLKAAGINNLNDIFIATTVRQNENLNNTFSNIENKTLAVGALYSSTVNTEIGKTFDYGVKRAKEAIAELKSAIRYAEDAADDLRSSARKARKESRKSKTYNDNSRITINKNMTDSQIERRIKSSLFDEFAMG